MEFGVLGLDGFQSSENALSLDGETSKHKWGAPAARSVGVKQEGSGFSADDWRSAKVAKTDGGYTPASTALFARNIPLNPVSSDANMLSFSSCSKSDTSTFPYFQQTAPKNAGYYSGSSSGMYLLNGVRGPFTPSQWLELEQQALIYKYMTANEPIPAQLLIPIKKALESAGLFGFSAGTLRPTPWGWGSFRFGYSNSNDPEPGRCRRTDGKKWRCSRDAMPDQKYCERHMNRGRHRSRKHVEGQATNGHSVSGATKSTAAAITKQHTPPSMVAPAAGLSNSFDMTHHYNQAKSLQHSASNPSMNPLLNRMLVNSENSCQGLQDTSQLSFLSLSGSNPYSVPKHRNTNEESAPSNFATSSTGSPLFTITTSQKNSTYGDNDSTHGLNGSDGSSILWPGLQSPLDSTQLSMSSIPMGSADYRQSHQHLEMGLGVGAQSYNNNNRQSSWIPSSWEPSMGGPLGEALQSGNGDGKKTSSSLNLLPKGWEGMGGYQLSSSSPTGVLQKSALVTLSNSSAGSSPRADNSLCNDLLGSTTLAHSSSLPALD
ncbi:hypothetical protein V2J09_019756 [Rumex salicifolius]